jgi:putative membrane protein
MHQRMITALGTEDAKEFDETYMEQQVMAHRTAVTLFETAAKTEADPELKAFAQKHLPHLRMHLTMAQKTKDLVD